MAIDLFRAGIYKARNDGIGATKSAAVSLLKRKYRYWRRPETGTHSIANVEVTVPLGKEWQLDRFNSIHNERFLLEDFVNEIENDDVVFDVGAYLGWHSIVATEVASEGEVIAFEPHPVSYQRLTEVVDLINSDVDTYNVGLGEKSETVKMPAKSSAAANIFDTEPQQFVEVETQNGDSIIEKEGLSKPTVCKIDVEGAETAVLRGLSETIRSGSVRLIYCELHPEKAPEGDDVIDVVSEILEEESFSFTLLENRSKSIVKAKRNARY